MKQAILVIGMHRSGTSALAGVLDKLGLYGGRTPMPANNSNPAGYFENLGICRANDSILAAFGMTWDKIQNDKFIPNHQVTYNLLGHIIQSEFENNPLIYIKDPRICLLLPFYKKVLADLGYNIGYIQVERNPDEIVNSLVKREEEKNPEYWIELIKQYKWIASTHLPDKKTVIKYRDLLIDPQGVTKRIIADFPFIELTDQKLKEILLHIKPMLRHHVSHEQD